MNKKYLITFAILVGLATAQNASAEMYQHDHEEDHIVGHGAMDDHDDNAQERVEHYAVERPQTIEQAESLLDYKMKEVSTMMEKHSLDDMDMEKLHEESYWLEAIVDRLREEQTEMQEAMLDNLDEAVQAIHFASEKRQENAVKAWFPKLETAANEVLDAF